MPSPHTRPSNASNASRPGRYDGDVLAAGWQKSKLTVSIELELEVGQVLEDPTSGWCGAVVRWENGLVVLEDRRGRLRSFPMGPGLWLEGSPVSVKPPKRRAARTTHTASGSRVGDEPTRAKQALPSRIYVEGRHDAELVEKVWGHDLRVEGVVVEMLDGVDDLSAVIKDFAPGPGRRMGILVDHLVPGTKEQRIVDAARALPQSRDHVLILGHPYVDVWQSVRPQKLGWTKWPVIPRGTSWKHGILAELGWPHRTQADVAQGWKRILGTVDNYADLQPELLGRVEELIDFVTAPSS